MAKYSDEDLKPHKSVAVFVMDSSSSNFLAMHHKKHDMLAPVLGKVHPGERVDVAASRELKEETGMDVKPTALRYLGSYKKEYNFDGSIVWVETHCFGIVLEGFENMLDYIVQNKEPEKHDDFGFHDGAEIVKHIIDQDVRVADAFRWLYFVFGQPSR